MVALSVLPVFVVLAVVPYCLSSADYESENRRKFVKKKLRTKSWLSSLFAPPHVEETIVGLRPVEGYPIWKVHKYKGIELRPVHQAEIPVLFGGHHQYPVADESYHPHQEYGVPSVDDTLPFSVEDSDFDIGGLDLGSPEHGNKFSKIKSILELIKLNKNLLKKLKSQKGWNSETVLPPVGYFPNYKKPATYVSSYLPLPIPEIPEAELPAFDNLRIPELPEINLAPYAGALPSQGPYLSVNVEKPTIDFVSNPEPENTYQTTYPQHTPAPYYGAPPLYDSYGTPLPPDAYSSASTLNESVFNAPENKPKSDNIPQISRNETGVIEAIPNISNHRIEKLANATVETVATLEEQ